MALLRSGQNPRARHLALIGEAPPIKVSTLWIRRSAKPRVQRVTSGRRIQAMREVRSTKPRSAEVPKALFWRALISGIGLFALRLIGDDDWWTGHLVYRFPPR